MAVAARHREKQLLRFDAQRELEAAIPNICVSLGSPERVDLAQLAHAISEAKAACVSSDVIARAEAMQTLLRAHPWQASLRAGNIA